MTDATQSDEDDIALAGEYALHLMDAETRLAFERRLDREPALRALVREWDEGLVPLADEIPPEAPPRQLESALRARLFDERPGTRGRRGLWLGVFGGIAAAAVLAVVAFVNLQPPSPVTSLTSEIAAEDRSLVFAARFDAASGTLEIERVAGAPLPGRTHELWLIAEGAPAPVSLGVLSDAAQARVDLPEALVEALEGGTLAVSDEPPGGSPTGQPTGDVLAVGTVGAG